MLHLFIITVVCAVSAPGTELIGLKNSKADIIRQFNETGKNPEYSLYNVSTDCSFLKQKDRNRTSSFLYHFNYQYKNNENSYCSAKKNFSESKKKNEISLNNFPGVKRNLLWMNKHQKIKENIIETPVMSEKGGINLGKNFNVNFKKKRRKRTAQKHLNQIKLIDDLDINKRIEKIVKEIANENLKTKSSVYNSSGVVTDKNLSYTKESPLERGLKKRKNAEKTKNASISVNTNQNNKLLYSRNVEKDLQSVSSLKKANRFRRAQRVSRLQKNFEGSDTKKKETMLGKSGLRNTHVVNFGNFSNFPYRQKFTPQGEKNEKYKKMTWPRHNNKMSQHKRVQSKYKAKPDPNELTPKQNSEARKKSFYKYLTKGDRQKSKQKSSLLPKFISLGGNNGKLKSIFQRSQQFLSENDSKMHLPASHNSKNTRTIPLKNQNKYLESESEANLEYNLPNNENLTPNRYLKIRHALRNYLIHNNAWSPLKRTYFYGRKKRCGGNCGSGSRKCWRSAPLLCIPYIRKGQDDLLKYLIKNLQKMLGKPFPQKVDIFEKTKYKPNRKKQPDSTCEDVMCNSEGSEGETKPPGSAAETTTACHTSRETTSKTRRTTAITSPTACPTTTSFPTTTPFSPTTPCSATPKPNPVPNANLQWPPVSPPPPSYRYMNTPQTYPVMPMPCPPPPQYFQTPPPPQPPPVPDFMPNFYCPTTPRPYPATPRPYPATPRLCPPTTPRPYPSSPYPSNPYPSNPYLSSPHPYPVSTYLPPTTPTIISTTTITTTPGSTTPKPLSSTNIASASHKTCPASTSTPKSSSGISITTLSALPSSGGPSPISTTNAISTSSTNTNNTTTNNSTSTNTKTTGSHSTTPKSTATGSSTSKISTTSSQRPSQPSLSFPENDPMFPSPSTSHPAESKTTQSSNSRASQPHVSNNPTSSTPFPSNCPCPPQGAPTPMPHLSTAAPQSFCYWGISKIPNDSPDFFSPTTPFYAVPSNCPPMAPQPPQSSHFMPSIPPNCNPVAQGKQYPNCPPEMENNPPQPAYPSNPLGGSDSFKYGVQCTDKPKQRLDTGSNASESVKVRLSENKNPKTFMLGDNFKTDNRKEFFLNHQNFQPLEPFKYRQNANINQQKVLKIRRHKGIPKYSLKEAPQVYNYNFYQKYPLIRQNERNNMRSVKYSMPWFFGRDYNRDIKKNVKKSHKRQKRDNYYVLDENPKSEEYWYDATYNNDYPDESIVASYKIHKNVKKKVVPNSGFPTTPPSFAMFNELAVEMSQSESVTDETVTTPIDYEALKIAPLRDKMKKMNEMASTTPAGHLSHQFTAPEFTLEAFTPCVEATDVPITTKKIIKTGLVNLGILEKDSENNQEVDNIDYGLMPTTLNYANIVIGPKREQTKPAPKVYTKVYPDSLPCDTGKTETSKAKFTTTKTTTTATSTTTKTTTAAATTTVATTSRPTTKKSTTKQTTTNPNLKIQLLTVCEGYLEIIKLVKAQNLPLKGEVDANLSRFCENVISQSFNSPDFVSSGISKQPPIPTTRPKAKQKKSLKKPIKFNSTFGFEALEKSREKEKAREKIVVGIPSGSVLKRGLEENGKPKSKKHKVDNNEGGIKKNRAYIDFDLGDEIKNQKRFQRKEDGELLKKGMSEEQVRLLHLLRKRKRALMSWLFNSKDDQNKLDEMKETEYFEDEDYPGVNPNLAEVSGKIKLKKNTGTTTNQPPYINLSVFPVYAKDYGYDKGGELREVEILWRKVNEQTHEKKIFKNISVLALLLTSTTAPDRSYQKFRQVGNDRGSEISKVQSGIESKVGRVEVAINGGNKTKLAMMLTDGSSQNGTLTFTHKPDPSSIVGTPSNATTAYPNTTHKISHTVSATKDFVKEYTIEFLNYAVYILPIMFTILFLFCCICCFFQVLKTRQKKKRKKRKNQESSSEDSEITEESEPEPKKKHKSSKQIKLPEEDSDAEPLEKTRSKAIWNVLKLGAKKSSSEFRDKSSQTEKKRSFLRFLKGKKDEGKADASSSTPQIPPNIDENIKELTENEEKSHEESNEPDPSVQKEVKKEVPEEETEKLETQNEADERRELIALLEELKKIETENTQEKKEQKSVQVQYTTQDENPTFRNPYCTYGNKYCEMPKPYPFYPKHPHFHEPDYNELYEDAGELTELLPCEYDFYSTKKNFLRRSRFSFDKAGKCEGFFKMFRNSGLTHEKPFREINILSQENKNRKYTYKRFTNPAEADLGVPVHTETEMIDEELHDMPQLGGSGEPNLVEEMETFKRQLNRRKYVRLKDDGVLCRL